MAGVLVNQAEVIALKALLNHTAQANNLVLRLFTNNKTPAEADTEADYTEANGYDYAAKTLTGASWTVNPGAPSSATYAEQVWTFTGALGNVYGYYYTANGVLVAAERFPDGPYNIQNSGDTIKVTPTITAD